MSNPAALNITRQLDQLPVSDVQRLLEIAAQIQSIEDLALRRKELLLAIAELVGADAGHWAWGRGRAETQSITPIALVDFGYTPQQMGAFFQLAMDPEYDEIFRLRILKLLGDQQIITTSRKDLLTEAEIASSSMSRNLRELVGLESWVHCLRYGTVDTWSCLFLFRRSDRAEFGDREAIIADLVMSTMTSLHANIEETLPAGSFEGLSPRQRTVMGMLLDGLARKEIAQRLQISEETVANHIKMVFKHFNVHSTGELAALFLKGR